MLDVLGIGEDLTVDGLELVGAWPEHFHDDVRSHPRRRGLVAVLATLDEAKHEVSNVEGPIRHSTAMVPGATLAGTWPSEGGQRHGLHLADPWHP